MKYGIREIFNVSFFDKEGNFITELNSLQSFTIRVRDYKGSIHINDYLYDDKLLDYIGGNYGLKIVCDGVARNYETGKDHSVGIVIDDLDYDNLWSIDIRDDSASINQMSFKFTKNPKILFGEEI